MLETGETLEIDRAGARRGEKVQVGRVCIDSGTIDEVVEDIVIRDRRHLSEDGFVLPIIAINKHSGKNETLPEIVSRGFMSFEDGSELLQEARQVVARTLESSSEEERTDWGVMQEKIRADLKRFLSKQTSAASVDYAGDSGGLRRAVLKTKTNRTGRKQRAGFREFRESECRIASRTRRGFGARRSELLRRRPKQSCSRSSRQLAENIPITIAGARTGLTGGRVPQGGWAVSLEKFRRLEICPGRAIAGRRRLARCAASRGGAHRPVLRARSHRAHRQHRRNHRHQRQRIAQFSLWRTRRHILRPARRAHGRHGCSMCAAATKWISRSPSFRCRTPPRTLPDIRWLRGWIGSICSRAAKARSELSRRPSCSCCPRPPMSWRALCSSSATARLWMWWTPGGASPACA